MNNDSDQISTADAAALIGITKRAVIDALNAGKITGKRLSRQWIVSRESALAYRDKKNKRRASVEQYAAAHPRPGAELRKGER